MGLKQIEAIAARHGLIAQHPPEALAEAQKFLASPGTDDPDLLDLRELPFVTIDYPTSMDLDQALLVERDGPDWLVRYAIADASYYVRPGTALHREALRRGATFYLPGLTVPMLPTSLSEGQISLLPGVDRRALVFQMRVDSGGACTETRVVRAVIRSQLKTWYEAVQRFLDGGEPPSAAPAIQQSLLAMAEVGQARERNAQGRGVVRIRRAELEVHLDEGMLRFVALREARHPVERYNEHISLLTNSEAAALLAQAEPSGTAQPIYRVVEPPPEQRLSELARRIRAVAHAQGRPWSWEQGSPLASFLASLPEGDPVAMAIHRQAMLVQGRALYQARPGPHAAVGAQVYGRFTAPMREVVGIFLHAEVVEQLERQARPQPPDPARIQADLALREAVIEAAARARTLQRDLDRAVDELVLAQLLEDDRQRGRVRLATVMGFGGDKVHLLLDDPPIDLKWYFAHLAGQWGGPVQVSRDGVALAGPEGRKLVIGDRVAMNVSGFDQARRRWELRGQKLIAQSPSNAP